MRACGQGLWGWHGCFRAPRLPQVRAQHDENVGSARKGMGWGVGSDLTDSVWTGRRGLGSGGGGGKCKTGEPCDVDQGFGLAWLL